MTDTIDPVELHRAVVEALDSDLFEVTVEPDAITIGLAVLLRSPLTREARLDREQSEPNSPFDPR